MNHPQYNYFPKAEFDRIRSMRLDDNDRLTLIAGMCRLNALVAVKRAGSGHLGTTFSSLDIVTRLYFHDMNTATLGIDHPDRDIYFSSKGHDVPGLYAVLYALGIVPLERFFRLRRLGGLDGHPEVGIPGIEANSGSLGMGVSKARGIAWAKRHFGRKGHVYVMLGDGELQEGQNFEAFQASVQQQAGNFTVIVDHNKVQSDKPVSEIVDLLNIEDKLNGFGWSVFRCDGHDQVALQASLEQCRKCGSKPNILIADTVKGRGVSFMEHPQALLDGNGYYRWHAGAPNDQVYAEAHAELLQKVIEQSGNLGLLPPMLAKWLPPEESVVKVQLQGEPESAGASIKPVASVTDEFVAQAFGEALVEAGKRRADLVVMDADLSADCRLRPFELAFPECFIECGIAEQDMVSMAGGLARQGLLPVVNSFASFLASRANEQIYNNATENSKIIYALHYAGLIPAGPGKSHQSIRDISLLAALPNMVIVQPCNAEETRKLLHHAVEVSSENFAIRLAIGPSPRKIILPDDYRPRTGRGTVLREGTEGILFAYGPVLLNEALLASEILAEQNVFVRVVNMPWLNRIDDEWFGEMLGEGVPLFVLEDHSPVGGLGHILLHHLSGSPKNQGRSFRFHIFGVEGWPACGTPTEALRAHKLDGRSVAKRIEKLLEQERYR